MQSESFPVFEFRLFQGFFSRFQKLFPILFLHEIERGLNIVADVIRFRLL